jgi:hypothetical protein
LVNHILKSVGAQTASDFGDVTPSADYVWGKDIDLKDIKPGDILQFRDHLVKTRTQKLGKYKWEDTGEESTATRPHHTGVVVEVPEDGSVVVVEQNVKPDPKKVLRHVIVRLAPDEYIERISSTDRKIIKVTGTVRAYRPVPKAPKGAMLFPQDEKPITGGWRTAASYVQREGGSKRRPRPLGMG